MVSDTPDQYCRTSGFGRSRKERLLLERRFGFEPSSDHGSIRTRVSNEHVRPRMTSVLLNLEASKSVLAGRLAMQCQVFTELLSQNSRLTIPNMTV
jgi:hypothetical protein